MLNIVIAAGMLMGTVLCYALATALIIRLVVLVLPGDRAHPGFWKGVAVMMIVTLITAATHLIEIALWAIVLLMCGEAATFETAF